jgi:diamine N-acetyltransferase
MIVGDRIVLRAWERSDLETFLRWFNDAEVTINLGNAYPALSADQEERFYQNLLDDMYHWAIVIKEGGLLIGNCSLHQVDLQQRSAEVGLVIGEKAYWNQGLGRETLRLLQEVVFEGLGLNRLYLRHFDFNERGHRCYLAAGFVEEGRLRQACYIKGSFRDEVRMAVLAEEYWARKR